MASVARPIGIKSNKIVTLHQRSREAILKLTWKALRSIMGNTASLRDMFKIWQVSIGCWDRAKFLEDGLKIIVLIFVNARKS